MILSMFVNKIKMILVLFIKKERKIISKYYDTYLSNLKIYCLNVLGVLIKH